jgi:hypothetical protein
MKRYLWPILFFSTVVIGIVLWWSQKKAAPTPDLPKIEDEKPPVLDTKKDFEATPPPTLSPPSGMPGPRPASPGSNLPPPSAPDPGMGNFNNGVPNQNSYPPPAYDNLPPPPPPQYPDSVPNFDDSPPPAYDPSIPPPEAPDNFNGENMPSQPPPFPNGNGDD